MLKHSFLLFSLGFTAMFVAAASLGELEYAPFWVFLIPMPAAIFAVFSALKFLEGSL